MHVHVHREIHIKKIHIHIQMCTQTSKVGRTCLYVYTHKCMLRSTYSVHVSTHRSLHQEMHTYARRILSRSTCRRIYLPHIHGDLCVHLKPGLHLGTATPVKHCQMLVYGGSSRALRGQHPLPSLHGPLLCNFGQSPRELGSHPTTKRKPDSWSQIASLWIILGKIHIQYNVQV